jgi:hypothetical protein
VFGVGDNAGARGGAAWLPPLDIEHDHAPGPELDEGPSDAYRTRTTRVAQRQIIRGARETPATPATTSSAVPRVETREAIEQARLGYRTARPMVEREVERTTEPSVWSALIDVLPDTSQNALRQIEMSRTIMTPAIQATMQMAQRRAREAEAGEAVKWLDAFDALLAAHRLVLSLVSPFEDLRIRVAQNAATMPGLGPVWVLVAAALDSVNHAQAVFEELARGFDALSATVNEGFDDIVEAGQGLADAATSGLGMGLIVVGALYVLGKRSKG